MAKAPASFSDQAMGISRRSGARFERLPPAARVRHCMTMERKPENFEALSRFFLDPSFIRIAVTTTKDIGLPSNMQPCIPVMGQLRQEMAIVASALPCKRIFVESSKRADPVVRDCFDQLTSLTAFRPIPVERFFMPPKARASRALKSPTSSSAPQVAN